MWEMGAALEVEGSRLELSHGWESFARARGRRGGAGGVECGSAAWSQVMDELTSTRVLCMSFEEGCNVTDLEGLHRMGLEVNYPRRGLRTGNRNPVTEYLRTETVNLRTETVNLQP